MNFDFGTIMVIAVVVTGVIWGIDAYFWAPKRKMAVDRLKASSDNVDEETIEKVGKEPILVEYARSFFPVILIVLILRSFIVEPFRIPSGSMMPTLLVGDFILVNKYTYGLRVPVTNTKIMSIGSPERGDVAVFRFPLDPSTDYIKRVIGVPGDHIVYRNKTLYINGEKIKLENEGVYTSKVTGLPVPGVSVLNEDLGTVKHNILVERNKPNLTHELIVPEGHYFVMGDNRDNSNDSRFWGTVPEANLVGRAFFIWMNWNFDENAVEWSRIGTSIE
jgi:signal peptidase I